MEAQSTAVISVPIAQFPWHKFHGLGACSADNGFEYMIVTGLVYLYQTSIRVVFAGFLRW